MIETDTIERPADRASTGASEAPAVNFLTEESDPGGDQHRMRSTPPDDWEPSEILYGQISCQIVGSRLKIFYKDLGRKQRIDIDEFIEEIRNPPPPPPEFMATYNPLDLEIKASCYVVLELDRDLKWTFDAVRSGVTLKDATDDPYYGRLTYVADNGTKGPNPLPGCRIVHFAAKVRTEENKDPFNLVVGLEQISPTNVIGSIAILIDPDIRNTGGSGAPG